MSAQTKDALVNWLRQFARGKEGFSTPQLLAAADRLEQCAAPSVHETPAADDGFMARREPWTHDLKCWPPFFSEILCGNKSFELRKNDRDYRVGDTLLLREWEPNEEAYTGREIRLPVKYILTKSIFGLQDGFCILGFDNPVLRTQISELDANLAAANRIIAAAGTKEEAQK